ncbi:replication factor C large subunit [Halocatena pleomorpha]|uniref:Replication factor C large subunit n=1 Tax=Halocatena pleomorpha TaxID=1785090 RepID=A0A3P3RIU4_9EURY|nr:replication factor C large subunit [Halocatena pleomorpha]RRJ33411.1 replication factor C large subunit [Halocatena pleomorpha]
MTDWTEKYRPTTLDEVRGNNKARDALRKWAESWDEHRESAILHGSPGVGKTSAAHALANDMNWSTIELNASDQRTADAIERVAGGAAMNQSLSGTGRQLVLLDEADNIHGNADRGGARAVTELVKETQQPMVLIANEYYEMSNALRNACQEIEFRDVSARSIVPVLRDICRKEDIEYESAALDAIAETNSGDLRGAVNDLQAIAGNRGRIEESDVITDDRDQTEGIFQLLDAVFKEEDARGALEFSYDVDETPDDVINWIEDNVPKDYHGAELADAYERLAAADRWLGRVRATQNYSYWRYVSDNTTAGVAAARREPKGGWTRYSPPSYWSKLGRSKSTRSKRDYIAQQIATSSGTSIATARREILPYLATMTHHCTNRELTVIMAARYDLDAEHVSFVTGSGENTKKVESIVAEAQRLRSTPESGDADGTTDDSTPEETASPDSTEPDGGETDDTDETDDPTETDDADRENDDQQTGLGDFV